MAVTLGNIFVNLPVKDLQRTMKFFQGVGFEFNPQFTDEKAACLVIGENIFAMLLTEEFFKSFTKKEIPDTAGYSEVIVALSADSRGQVDEIVNKALASGGKPYSDPVDHGFMYTWSFQDPDGHLWEVMFMDPSAVPSE
ncbi:VOC family protein [Paenibacillus timonensis]|uniref:VOC family protein n=1 Tax=Paenibacillus timonensis TaxID=225915 RepID=A0ABW3SA90_9BACL|nr:VOC family protein [Paenibacillus timonensis]MCH1640043.1 VOC family protein [Paenibacillus timonensis]